MIEMIYMNWWSECYHCGTKLTADEQYDDDDNEFIMDIEKIVGAFNGPAFCCQECSDIYFGRRDASKGLKKKQRRELEAIVASRLGTDVIFQPESENRIFDFEVKWNEDTPWVHKGCVHFNIPGIEGFPAAIHVKRDSPLAEPRTFYTHTHTLCTKPLWIFSKNVQEGRLTKRFLRNKYSPQQIQEKRMTKYRRLTLELLKEIAADCKTRREFYDKDPSAFVSASRKDVLDEVCSHMKGPKKCTPKQIMKEAKKYKSRSEFRLKVPKMYGRARRLGILEEACAHMPARRKKKTEEVAQ